MRTILLAYIVVFLASLPMAAQTSSALSAAEAQEDLATLRFALEYTHPRLYKYEDRATFEHRWDSAYATLTDSISGVDFLRLVSRLNAQVNCGHLYTIPQGDLSQTLANRPVMPVYVKLVGDEIYLFDDCTTGDRIPNGSKLLSINGHTAADILAKILPGIPSDGWIGTRKRRLAERYIRTSFQGFDLYYYLYVDRSPSFEITYLEYGTGETKQAIKQGITFEERKAALTEIHGKREDGWYQTPSPQFEAFPEDDYALLTLTRSFYNREIDPNYDSLLQGAFAELKEKQFSQLVIDLRENEGGSEHQEMELISYLYDHPNKLYQNILQSHLDWRPLKSIILERDTAALVFNNDDEYMRRLSNHMWINNYEYSRNLQWQPPKEPHYEGQVYVLINGGTFSSAADMAGAIKKTTNAVFIGEEAGGTFEGPTGGISIVVELPHSQTMVRISPNIHLSYRYQQHPIGRGVLPDHEVHPTATDLVEGRDPVMEKAQELIQLTKEE
ncbi:MAG: S41 family peptidase [Bacteroidota bacterium]